MFGIAAGLQNNGRERGGLPRGFITAREPRYTSAPTVTGADETMMRSTILSLSSSIFTLRSANYQAAWPVLVCPGLRAGPPHDAYCC